MNSKINLWIMILAVIISNLSIQTLYCHQKIIQIL